MAGGTGAGDVIPGWDAPAGGAVAVTKSDATIVNCRSLYVGGAGDVAVTDMQGNVTTFSSVPAGTILPVRCNKVMSTNTTATNIVALY